MKADNRKTSAVIVAILGVGLVLGAAVESWIAGKRAGSHSSGRRVHTGETLSSNTVEIDVEAQKKLGIAVETAERRSLREILYATGTVGEDPGNTSSLQVPADVFEEDIVHVEIGKAVKVRVTLYPNKVFQGKITHVAETINPEARTAKVRCVVADRDGLLKPGMFATIAIPLERSPKVLAVPDKAVQQIGDRAFVFVRISATEFQKREVKTGNSAGRYTEITSGLEAGEQVATRGNAAILRAVQ